ncbi:transmembrane protease serine 9-like [Amphibalanus amphitrite]|uniref:transmembrane protease serine 9-like n=1 Tax=Amphibalanus amphitrite TaxID=1232801 RepID=UPI001C905F80|nr:transmembrane protease serine 9-like [Amphibalanus amphitrite]
MARLLCTALLATVLLRTTAQGTRVRQEPPSASTQGRSALLNDLSAVPIEDSHDAFESDLRTAEELGIDELTQTRGSLTRITFGLDAAPGEIPWIAAIVLRDQDFVFCSATVISEFWLLTAAHCIRPYKASELDVLVGKYSRDADPNEVRRQVTDIRIHPQNVPFIYLYDVALLRVQQSLVPAAQIVDLPVSGCTITDPATCLVGRTGLVAGWGLLQGDTFELPTVLQKGEIPIIDNRNCARRFGRLQPPPQIYDSMLCAGDEFDSVDTCQGDSGGPLLVASDSGSYTLEGVVSFGYGCGRPGYYGVYQRVASVTSWIAAEMAS